VRLLGENLLLRPPSTQGPRVVDQCLHMGARFSRKPECYTPETHHLLVPRLPRTTSVTASCRDPPEPGSKLCGQARAENLPVTEAKGMVFVFVGDIEPPRSPHDVPPAFSTTISPSTASR